MLGVNLGLEEDELEEGGLEDDRGQAKEPSQVGHQHCEKNQTSDYHPVQAADAG